MTMCERYSFWGFSQSNVRVNALSATVKAAADEVMIRHKVSVMWGKLPVTASIMIITPCVHTAVKPKRGSAGGQANSSGGHDIMCGKTGSARAGTRKQKCLYLAGWRFYDDGYCTEWVSPQSNRGGKKEEEEEENKKEREERNSRCQQ